MNGKESEETVRGGIKTGRDWERGKIDRKRLYRSTEGAEWKRKRKNWKALYNSE